MKRIISTQHGLTLIEVLVTLVIMSIVSGVVYSVFTTGLKLYQKIGVEAQLRDDADYVATMILNEMYNYPPNYIKEYDDKDGGKGIELVRYFPKEVNRYLVDDVKTDDGKIKIQRRQLIYFKDDKFFIETFDTEIMDDGTEKTNESTTELSSESSKFTTKDDESSSIRISCTKPELIDQCPHGTINLDIVIGENKERFSNLLKTEPLELESSFGF